jgi:hypothetical protein
MLVPSAVGVMEDLLEQFRPCFSRPQFRNSSTYILGLVACEGRAVWGHDLVTTHYVNGDVEHPVRLALYVKKETYTSVTLET